MFKDVLLTLPAYPATVAPAALRKALDAVRLAQAHVTCLVSEPAVPLPVAFRPYSQQLERELDARQGEVRRIALAQLAAFEEEARRAGLAHEGRVVGSPLDAPRDPFVDVGRLRDLTVVPFLEDEACADLVQALVFESGRPVLLLPDDGGETFAAERVVVGWDFSRAAARALADAMPLLRRARKVRIVTVAGDDEAPQEALRAGLIAHLARNGVDAALEEVARGRRPVGEALDAAAEGADLLVMGAFGHSRIRDFFLGGATRHVLKKPRLPTFLSH